MHLIHLSQDRVQWRVQWTRTETSGSKKGGEFLGLLSDYQLPKCNSSPHSYYVTKGMVKL